MIIQKNNLEDYPNKHLAVVFNEILPALTRAGIKYWVFGGVGIAGVVGKFIRETQDVDVYVLNEDFAKIEFLLKKLCEIHGDWDGDHWKLVYSVLKYTKRWKFDVYIKGVERFSVLPIYRVGNGVEIRFVDVQELSNRALIQEFKKIEDFKFFSPPQDIIIQLLRFRFLTEPFMKNYGKQSIDKDSKYLVDARAVFTKQELARLITSLKDQTRIATGQLACSPTFEQYLAAYKPKGQELFKEIAQTIRLKIKGVKNPRRLLRFIKYLEEYGRNAVSKFIIISKALAEERVSRWKLQGVQSKIFESSNNPGNLLYGRNKIPFNFDKKLAREISELLNSSANQVSMFQLMRAAGYLPGRFDREHDFSRLPEPPIPFDEISKEILSPNLSKLLEKYVNYPKIQNFIISNHSLVGSWPVERIQIYLDIFVKIDDSSSPEIKRLKKPLLTQLFKSGQPAADYQKIESIFVSSNQPLVEKIYGTFKILFNSEKFKREINEPLSLFSRSISLEEGYQIISQDLLRVQTQSDSRSLKRYLEIIQESESLLDKYFRSGLSSLKHEEREQLGHCLDKLETLSVEITLKAAGNIFKTTKAKNIIEQLNQAQKELQLVAGQTVLERISEKYLQPLGLENLAELFEKMRAVKISADKRGREMISLARAESANNETILKLEAGDLLKAVNIYQINNILPNGLVAPEFLGEKFDSDSRPLAVIISLVKPEDVVGSIKGAIDVSLFKDFSEVLLVLKNRGQYRMASLSQPCLGEISKIELFSSNSLNDRHYYLRTGFPSTEIGLIIIRDNLISSRPKELGQTFFKIAQSGYYIPVINESGKVLFTPELYDEYRQSFAGLEKFGGQELVFRPTTVAQKSYDRLTKMAAVISQNNEQVSVLSQIFYREIKKVLEGERVDLQEEFAPNISGAEFLDIGSSCRQTNIPEGFDIDLNLRLNLNDFSRAPELAQSIENIMTFSKEYFFQGSEDHYQLRVKNITAIAGQRLERAVDLDISLVSKAVLNGYCSHNVIGDKLNYIKSHYGLSAYEYALANIILTKQILKGWNVYDNFKEGGLSGVGVEIWILSYGGNMEEAFRNFQTAAYENNQKLTFEEFKRKYRILNAGVENLTNLHQNYIKILKPDAYELMLKIIDDYFSSDNYV